jgi:DNA mismatch endonuclease (patch repair protein)
MQAIKSKDTGPEMRVRKLVYAQGYRYRLHRKDLPGCPDLVFSRLMKVIFVHGCFWHGHNCQRGARVPVQNRSYWINKITKNRERDLSAQHSLNALGWEFLVLWECELKDKDILLAKIRLFLGNHET